MSVIFNTPVFSSAVIASPNSDFRKKMLEELRSTSCIAQEAQGGAEALAKLEAGDCQALLLDSWLPDLDVSDLLSIVKKRHPEVKVLVIGSGSGPQEYRPEPERNSQFVTPITQSSAAGAAAGVKPAREKAAMPDRAFRPDVQLGRGTRLALEPASSAPQVEPLPGMIGVSHAMQNAYRLSRLVAARSTTVLLTGETGTGKELVARAIHVLSPRQKQPFITVNCAAIPESLLEAELFGYARGAFTGAFQSRMGRIHSAHGGTLFLDEVGDLPLSMQAKLLRFLQEGEVQRLGGHDVIRVDVRVIAATNAQLQQKVAEKAFREDLYYRVSAFPIDLVPLRRRPDDILTLALHFLDGFCQEGSLPSKIISSAAGVSLEKHTWPGNVRELRHVVERAFILSETHKEILREHVSLQMPWR